jgi:hypothetical protein
MGRLYLIPAVLGAMLGLASAASAQAPPGPGLTQACHSHADVAKMLDQKFAEQPSALGLQADGHLVEVFVSHEGTSWTIVVTRPDGWSCIVAVGQHWEPLAHPVIGPLA